MATNTEVLRAVPPFAGMTDRTLGRHDLVSALTHRLRQRAPTPLD